MEEKEMITRLLAQFPRSGGHMNDFFESDAEILAPGEGKLLFTTDEFSAEDFFLEEDAAILGWNLACCTISDVLASAGRPVYYGHALTLAAGWEQKYIDDFAGGIARALREAGAGFVGGDLGTASSWKYTGICLGFSDRPLTRKGAMPGDRIYMTGMVGAGNLMAALKLFRNGPAAEGMPVPRVRLPLRIWESELIRDVASCCIDTSDGLLNALNTLSDINGTGYRVSGIPYLEEGRSLCAVIGKPKTFLFAGECGEYELLFTVNRKQEKEFTERAKLSNQHFTYLGEVSDDAGRILEEDGKLLRFNDFKISARGYDQIEHYLSDLTNYIAHAQGTG